MPTPAQIRELPELTRIKVPREWEDMNGHVNVQYHVTMYNECTDPMLVMLGIDQEWIREGRVGLFDFEHHIWYQNEVHVGDEVGVYARFMVRNAKRMHGVVMLLNATRDCVASVIEFVCGAADLDARRTVAWPDALAARLDALIGEHETLSWPGPRSGAISV
jgi:acyl-CoA thioester hydrolase